MPATINLIKGNIDDICQCFQQECWQEWLANHCGCCCLCQFSDDFSCAFRGKCCCDDLDPCRGTAGGGSHNVAFSGAFDRMRAGTNPNNLKRCVQRTLPPYPSMARRSPKNPTIKIKLVYAPEKIRDPIKMI